MPREVPRFSDSDHVEFSHVLECLDATKRNEMKWNEMKCEAGVMNWRMFVLTKKPDVLSNKQRKRTVKLRSRWVNLSGAKASANGIPDKSGGKKEFQRSWRWSSSRSSEWTSSYTDWWTISDWSREKEWIWYQRSLGILHKINAMRNKRGEQVTGLASTETHKRGKSYI